MAEQPLRAGEHVALKHTTRTVRAAVESIDALLDVTTLTDEPPPDELVLNDIARVTLRTAAPIVADPYTDNRTTGAFILIDEDSNDTVAAGMVRRRARRRPRAGALPRRDVARERPGARPPLGLARHARRDRLADRPAGLGQVDDRRPARAHPGRGRPSGVLPRRRQPAPRALRRPGVLARRPDGEHPPRRARRAADGRRRAWSRSPRSSPPRTTTARSRASCTMPPGCRSSRSTSTRRSRWPRSATRRASTRAPARASWRTSPASARPTRCPSTPT